MFRLKENIRKTDLLSWGVTLGLAGVFTAAVYAINPGIGFGAMIMSGLSILGANAIGMWLSYYFSDKIALMHFKGKVEDVPANDPDPQRRDLYDDIHELLRDRDADNMPSPRIVVINHPMLNAFATGRNRINAVVTMTTGMLEKLNRRQIRAVMAHELSHVKNHDILHSTAIATAVAGVSAVANIAYHAKKEALQSNSKSAKNIAGIAALSWLGLTVTLFVVKALRAFVSRQRELEADHDGAHISDDPEALAEALSIISGENVNVTDPEEKKSLDGMAHFFFVSPFNASGETKQYQNNFIGNTMGFLANLNSTHPQTTTRVEELTKLKSQIRYGHLEADKNLRPVPNNFPVPA